MSELKLSIVGANGRMGRAVADVLPASVELISAIGLDQPRELNVRVQTLSAEALRGADVVVDFSHPDATGDVLAAMDRAGVSALVMGTTGHGDAQLAEIEAAAKRLAILRSGNFSLGVNLLVRLVERAARSLGPDWDVEVFETHHRYKVDAPSGTALMLGEAAANGRGVALNVDLDRQGERVPGAIGFSVSRLGDVVGDHAIGFGSEREILTLSHRALDRSVFAHGAVQAARWLHGKPAGLYCMDDVLGIDALKPN